MATGVMSPPHRVTSMPAGTAGGLATPATGPIDLAGQHFGAAMLYLVCGAGGVVWVAPELATGNYLSPHVAGVTHLFTLGWLTMTILGALHQLLPVALGAPMRWPKLGHAAFWSFAPGAGVFAVGVAANAPVLHHAGIALVAIGIVLAVTNLAATLPRARTRDATWAGIAIAIAFLSSTLVLGVILLHNLHTGFIAEARVRVLAAHLHVAIVGWALIMIVGVANRLLPMFMLAHGVKAVWTKRALVLLTSGVPLLVFGLIARQRAVTWIAVALLEGGLGCFCYQAVSYFRARVRRRLDVGMHFAATGLAFVVIAALIAPLVLWHGITAMRLATVYVLLGLVAGIVTFVSGFFYKIVPLLAWTSRYGGRTSAPGTPTIAQTFSARLAHVQLCLTSLGCAALAASILAGFTAGAYAGAALFLVGVLIFARQMVRVAFGRPLAGTEPTPGGTG